MGERIIHARNSVVSPLFLRRYSIDAPSILHRLSIVSMEERWSTDGLSMEYPLSFGYIKYSFLYYCQFVFTICLIYLDVSQKKQ